jgi:hypothetical protein
MQIYFAFLLLLYIVNPAVADAELYKYTDKNGILSFTDDFNKIPEDQRSHVEKTQPPPPDSPSVTPSSHSGVLEWLDRPLSKYIIAFIALAIFMLFVQSQTEGFVLKMVLKILFVGFLGAAIYASLVASGVATNQKSISSSESLFDTVKSAMPDPRTVGKVKKEIEQIEAQQERENEKVQSLLDAGENH